MHAFEVSAAMRVICLQENLAAALLVVERAVPQRSAIQSLGYILFDARADGLRLVATNQELTISQTVASQVLSTGAVALPARLVAEFVSNLRAGPIEFDLDRTAWSVRFASTPYSAHVKGLDPADYPIVPSAPDREVMTASEADLLTTINQVAFAAAADMNQPQLASVGITISRHQLIMAATDGMRLAMRPCPLIQAAVRERRLLLPARSLTELARLLRNANDPVAIAVSAQSNQVHFRLQQVELTSRIIDGDQPNYEKVIPTTQKTSVTIGRYDLAEAVLLASYFARDVADRIKIEVRPGGEDEIRVTAEGGASGDNAGTLPAAIKGPGLRIGMKAEFLSDVLNSRGGETVVLHFTSPLAACRVEFPDDIDYVHVLMPIRL